MVSLRIGGRVKEQRGKGRKGRSESSSPNGDELPCSPRFWNASCTRYTEPRMTISTNDQKNPKKLLVGFRSQEGKVSFRVVSSATLTFFPALYPLPELQDGRR